MNAAARLVHQGALSRHLVLTPQLTLQQIIVLALMLSIVLSALCTIYITQVTRVLHANYRHYLLEQNHLHVERSQLLLERSTWMMQSRIQHIAENKLGMVIPNHDSVVMVRE